MVVPDRSERWRVGIQRGALHATRTADGQSAALGPEVTIEAVHTALAQLLFSPTPVEDLAAQVDGGTIAVRGDRAALDAFLGTLDSFKLMFPIVTP